MIFYVSKYTAHSTLQVKTREKIHIVVRLKREALQNSDLPNFFVPFRLVMSALMPCSQ